MDTNNYDKPNWEPLEKFFERESVRCGEFMWMHSANGIEHYKHIDTRRYLRLDRTGQCYSGGGELIGRESALRLAGL